MTIEYYVGIEKSTGRYFSWEHDENFNVIGEFTDDISKAVHYEDKQTLIDILKVSNIKFETVDVANLSGES